MAAAAQHDGSAGAAHASTPAAPAGATSAPMAPTAPIDAPGDKPAPAVCPYGFGSRAGGGRRLGELECMLCSALLHEAVSAQPCAHVFCAACIAGARDCPACGRDVSGVASAPDAQGLVDAYLAGHGRSGDLVEAQQAAMAEALGGGGGGGFGGPQDASPASFFLFHGVRSMLGGNLDAALDRLRRCRALLEEELAAAEASEAAGGQTGAGLKASLAADAAPSPARVVACRLGAVCGSLGDCWRRRGDLAASETALRSAAAHLQPFAAGDADAADALAVTLAKLGDLQYYRAQQQAAAAEALSGTGGGGGGGEGGPERAAAAAALPYYERALAQRRALCGPLSGGQGGPGATLNLTTALAKVADAHETLGDAAAAHRAWRQAAAELHELRLVAGGALRADKAAAAKLRALEELLAVRGHAVPAPVAGWWRAGTRRRRPVPAGRRGRAGGVRLLRGPGAAAAEYRPPCALVVPDEHKCSDWELQLGEPLHDEFSVIQARDWVLVERRGGPAGLPPAELPAEGNLRFIAPRRGAQLMLGTSTFLVSEDTLAEAERVASEAAVDAARAEASAGTRFVGRDACAQCGAARGAPDTHLRACGGCRGVLPVYYCSDECTQASWRSGHKAACRRAQGLQEAV